MRSVEHKFRARRTGTRDAGLSGRTATAGTDAHRVPPRAIARVKFVSNRQDNSEPISKSVEEMDPPTRETRATARPKSRGHRQVDSSVQKPSYPTTLAPSAMSKVMAKPQPSRLPKDETEAPRPFMGQLSATQTKVVTTTTTTTTSFPPLLLNPPLHLHDMDPKQYPLAAAPTPASMKKFSFNVGGSRTTFEEADDSLMNIAQVRSENLPGYDQKWLTSCSKERMVDTVQLEKTQHRDLPPFNISGNPVPSLSGSHYRHAQASLQTPCTAPENSRKRPASPISISEAALRARDHPSRKKKLFPGSKIQRPSVSTRQSSLSRLRTTQTSTPLTPDVASNDISQEGAISAEVQTIQHDDATANQIMTTADAFEEEDCQILSPQSEITRSLSFQEEEATRTPAYDDSNWAWELLESGSAITPNPEEEPSVLGSSIPSSAAQRPPRPSSLNTTASQDASLPSPSLSPVTAAANLQNRLNYFEPTGPSQSRLIRPATRTPLDTQVASTSEQDGSTSPDSQTPTLTSVTREDKLTRGEEASNGALMKLPEMIETFEAMPEEMKSYIMYQMLRRCSKPVLHFVADVVNPALKCDFLRVLPVELCLNIIGYLDVKSLCAAAQVSKRWRRLIDSSEKVWKRLFDADGFQLQEGELARAIREGWGWQYASGSDDFEQDLSNFAVPSDVEPSPPSLLPTLQNQSATNQSLSLKQATSGQLRRSKRKAKPKTKPASRKQQKSYHSYSNSSVDLDDEAFLDMASATEGPYAAATAAAAAVPYPGIGLPSLKNLHLFKSIYMRHHVIRNTWMDDEVTPRHIAFRAHQRHVVTCLQFDSDKILTGSDDSNINVYDTQTGALRATLEGHDGGVWALQYEGNVLVSGSTDRSVRVWDIERGVCTQTFQGHTSTVRCLQILMPTQVGKTSDGRPIMMPKQPLIITGSRDSHLRVWKLPKLNDPPFHQAGPAPDGQAECPYFVRALVGHHHSVRAIAAHADTLVSGSYDCTVRVWKISTGETLHRLQGHTQKVYSVVLDHKRNRCISGSMDNVVRVWSLESGAPLFNLEGHSSLVGLLDLQHDRLVSAAADSTLRIWDPENGQCKSTLSAHTGAITCFQHDGHKVISGSDRTLKMWDVTTGEFVKDLLTDLSGVWQVKFNERRCVAAVQRNNLTYIEVSG